MIATILGAIGSIGIPILKWILEKREKRKLSDKEFTELILAHQKQRGGAGQTALDWKDSLKKLKASVAKKNDTEPKE